jgi:hypothetical protein
MGVVKKSMLFKNIDKMQNFFSAVYSLAELL